MEKHKRIYFQNWLMILLLNTWTLKNKYNKSYRKNCKRKGMPIDTIIFTIICKYTAYCFEFISLKFCLQYKICSKSVIVLAKRCLVYVFSFFSWRSTQMLSSNREDSIKNNLKSSYLTRLFTKILIKKRESRYHKRLSRSYESY